MWQAWGEVLFIVLREVNFVSQKLFEVRIFPSGGVSESNSAMVEVRRKDNESVDNLIRRFARKVQLSGIKYEVTKRQYKTRKPNKRQRQATAQRRAELREKFDRLDKLGLLSDKYTRRGQSFRGR